MMFTNKEIVELLNNDLANEYKHMHFYLHSSFVIGGLHRNALRQFLQAEAQSEMMHVQQFADKIVGLGGIPNTRVADFPTDLTRDIDILNYIIQMEQEVVSNYVDRREQAQNMYDKASGVDLVTFLEDQISQSKSDLDNVKKMVEGI